MMSSGEEFDVKGSFGWRKGGGGIYLEQEGRGRKRYLKKENEETVFYEKKKKYNESWG